MCRKPFSSENLPGGVRDRLQTRIPGCIFRHNPMNDCPSPEDPPVMTAQEKDRKTSLSEDGTFGGFVFPYGESCDFSHRRMFHPALVTQNIRRS
jgi:hypothetical protein